MSDERGLAVLSIAIALGVGAGEALRLLGWRPESTRRAVHTWTGLCVVASPELLTDLSPIYVLAAAFVGINVLAVRRRLLLGMHGIRRRSWGTAVFPLALIFALATCWTADPSRVFALQIAFLVLAVCDPFASWLGERVGRSTHFALDGEDKSLVGSAGFFVTAVGLTYAGLHLWAPHDLHGPLWLLAVVTAALATTAELIGRRGWDNLTIIIAVTTPLVAAHVGRATVADLAIAAVGATVFGVASLKARFLTLSGTLAASLFAFWILGVGGLAWAGPGFAFFVLASVLSKLGRRRKRETVPTEKGSQRDAGQVFANGGVAWALFVLHVFYPDPLLYWGYVGAFAAAAADTWGTEVGTYFQGKTISIVTGRPVEPGISGGISGPGTAGAVVGAASVYAPLLAITHPFGGSLGPAAGVVIASALAGAMLDSVLGGTVQALYREHGSERLTERPRTGDVDNERVRGFVSFTNDTVNVACTVAGAAGAMLGASAIFGAV